MAARLPRLTDLIPAGPVVGVAERLAAFTEDRPSGAAYTGPPREGWPRPLLPLQVFGVVYDLDLVLVSDHPDWNMHEYARLRTPDGPVWLCKDAEEGTLRQSIVADLPDLDAVLPEVSVPRHRRPVAVVDASTPQRLDLSLDYVNAANEPVAVRFRGPWPAGPQGKRNSSTMGHSRDTVLAALDLSHRSLTFGASIAIGGRRRPLRRLLGIQPFALAMVQTQAGFSIGAWSVAGRARSQRTVHTTPAVAGATRTWDVRAAQRGLDAVDLVQVGPLRTIRARFRRRPDALELESITVTPWDDAQPAAHVRFAPCLPDLTRPFEGPVRVRWVLDVRGQEGHAHGELVATADARSANLDLLPVAPRWTTDRPMRAVVRGAPRGGVAVEVARRD